MASYKSMSLFSVLLSWKLYWSRLQRLASSSGWSLPTADPSLKVARWSDIWSTPEFTQPTFTFQPSHTSSKKYVSLALLIWFFYSACRSFYRFFLSVSFCFYSFHDWFLLFKTICTCLMPVMFYCDLFHVFAFC